MVVKEIPSYIRRERRKKIVKKVTSKRALSQQIVRDFIIEEDDNIQLIYFLIMYTNEKATKEYKKVQEFLKSDSDPVSSIAILTEEQRMMLHMVYVGYWNLSGDNILINNLKPSKLNGYKCSEIIHGSILYRYAYQFVIDAYTLCEFLRTGEGFRAGLP